MFVRIWFLVTDWCNETNTKMMKINAVKFDLPLELSDPCIFHFLIQVHDTDLMRQCWIQTVVYICVEVERVELKCWSAILKSIYSESATKFEKITHSDLTFAKFCGNLRKPRLPSWKYLIVTYFEFYECITYVCTFFFKQSIIYNMYCGPTLWISDHVPYGLSFVLRVPSCNYKQYHFCIWLYFKMIQTKFMEIIHAYKVQKSIACTWSSWSSNRVNWGFIFIYDYLGESHFHENKIKITGR